MQEGVFHELINLHDGGLVTASVAVVRGREHRDDIPVVRPVVAVHHKLMCSCDQLQVIRVVELLRDILTERVSCTSWRDTPTASIIWIRPQEITDWPLMRNLHDSIELLNLIESIDTWRKSSMKAENVSLDDSGQWQVIEKTCEVLPNIGITVLSEALIIETIHLSDLLALMVSSKDGDSIWVPNLEGDQKGDGLH